MTRSALLLLMPERAAVFSQNSATSGAHKTLLSPPGSALLGWAAADGRYDKFKMEARTIFHSGRVRFSNATPLTEAGEPTWPVPQVLTYPKIGAKPFINGRLNTDVVCVGRNPDDAEQHEVVKGLLSASHATVRINEGGRLRTALVKGTAEPGKLFGYMHIEPSDQTRYAAVVEADDGALTDEVWRILIDSFAGRTLSLGRGAGTSYGGGYACEVQDGKGDDLWPRGRTVKGEEKLRVWFLSDCAIIDDRGAPTFAPSSKSLGLQEGGLLNERESAVSTRRYAPWNRTLGSRDIDRQVIEAGSVLTYSFPPGTLQERDGPGSVGLWQEAGLGRIWVNPPILQADFGKSRISDPCPPLQYVQVTTQRPAIEHKNMKEAHALLMAWLTLGEA